MARKLRIAAIALGIAAALAVVALTAAYYATQRVRPFYRQALQFRPQRLQQARGEFESRATALYSDARQAGPWQARFTAEQINGYLAAQRASHKLPELLHAPRVALAEGTISLGFRTRTSGIDTVVSVDAEVMLTTMGDVAVRITSVRAGALPMPVMQVAEQIASACRDLELPVRWTRSGGQPVALIRLSAGSPAHRRQVHLDTIELGHGELFLAGHTRLPPEAAATDSPSSEPAPAPPANRAAP